MLPRFYIIAIFACASSGHCIFFNVISMIFGRHWRVRALSREQVLAYSEVEHDYNELAHRALLTTLLTKPYAWRSEGSGPQLLIGELTGVSHFPILRP